MHFLNRALGVSFGLLLLVGHPAYGQEIDSDDPPYICQECHTERYNDWMQSGHNQAYAAQTFQLIWTRQRRPAECLSCHNTGYDSDTGTAAYYSVGCTACHTSIEGDTKDYSDHDTMRILSEATQCGTCHGEDHARTYTEWEASPHNSYRVVACVDCHDPHQGGLIFEDSTDLCASCHLQEVPIDKPYMHDDSNCTYCHPAPIETDNVHMHNDLSSAASCTDCHLVTENDQYDRYLANSGHTMTVTLTACTNCHGALHDLQADE